ncbi:glycosyltransferase family 2 protein [Gelidibacter salicanalis]|uniref:Glycosyltransferase family 2 protein n=1 Tax=Gelidibacter salicanalis TaxID=291193 RepID=A0A934NHQ4_9FLAO|nr:glycosyltransferase family 2 protein [Gelidibacter salicanalis]MBJ7879164.1 glycosyltransferase family 2 protein [Gelidibacter salicanalis]
MNFEPLVSVLMTVYNREKYISEAIESVLLSTYTNFELIIVDDRSKDNSLSIAKSYESKDQRIKVYLNEQNLGDYPNRNQAASFAKGKYLKYVDADDMIYPHGLEVLVYYMEQFPEAGYGLCSLPQDKLQKYPFLLLPKQAYQRHYFQQQLFHKAPLSAIINREVFNKMGGFTGKRMLGDFEMWNLLSQKHAVVLMPQGVVWYREHDEQEMTDHRNNPMEPFKYILLAEELIAKEGCPLNEEEKRKALNNLKSIKSSAVLSAFKHYGFKKGQELKAASGMSIISIFNFKLK